MRMAIAIAAASWSPLDKGGKFEPNASEISVAAKGATASTTEAAAALRKRFSNGVFMGRRMISA